jgi:uncharacterized protein (TIGR02453 family)
MPEPAAEAAAFEGFPKDAIAFLHELAFEMNRTWFEANKARYQASCAQPMNALLARVAAGLAKAYAPTRLGPPKLFRIHRDVRFSKDKSPYKTHVAGMIPAQEACAALYLHVGVEEVYFGAGIYYFDEAQLPRWRKLVAADRTGKPLAALVTRLRKAGYTVGGHEDYKKVPKPFAADHSRADFLVMRGLTAGFPPPRRGLLHEPGLADWLVKHGKAIAPMIRWLHENVKGPK